MKNKLLWSFGAVAAMVTPVLLDQDNPQMGPSLAYYTTQPLFYVSNVTHGIKAKINHQPYTQYDQTKNGNYKYYLGVNNAEFKASSMRLVRDFSNNGNESLENLYKKNPDAYRAIPDDIAAGMAFIDELPVEERAAFYSRDFK